MSKNFDKFKPLNGVSRGGLKAATDDESKDPIEPVKIDSEEKISETSFGFKPAPSFVPDEEENVTTETLEGSDIDDDSSIESEVGYSDVSDEEEAIELKDVPTEVTIDTTEELNSEEVTAVIGNIFDKTEENWEKNEPTMLEKLKAQEETKMAGFGIKASEPQSNGVSEKAAFKFGGRQVTTEKPEGIKPESRIKESEVKGWSKSKFEEILASEIGTGVSKISGKINIHISPEAMLKAVYKLVNAAGAEADSRGLDIWTDVSKFQKGIKGIVAQTMTTGVGRVSIATFADEVFNIIAEQPKVTTEEAKLRAAAIVTSYTGMNILELGNKASSTQADVLTLLLDKEVVPKEEDGAYALILKGLCNEIRYNDADENFVRITLALEKLFPYAQGTFSAKDFKTFKEGKPVGSMLVTVNNVLSEVVYTVIKEDK
jgi:hypothetical protein